MIPPIAPTSETEAGVRQRLLEAACEIFAQSGFRGATVAQICGRAKANIAAINYYFGSKENLYVEAWRHAHATMLAAHPPEGGVAETEAAARRLHGRIRALLQRAASERGLGFRMMSHEMAQPTGLLDAVFRDTIRPLHEAMERIVRELLVEEAPEETVRLCIMAVLGPCFQILRRQQLPAALVRDAPLTAERVEVMAAQLTTFALAGIAALRQGLGTNKETRTSGEGT